MITGSHLLGFAVGCVFAVGALLAVLAPILQQAFEDHLDLEAMRAEWRDDSTDGAVLLFDGEDLA